MTSSQILRFDDCELDRGLFQLRRNGQVVHLERIPLELLFLLAERPGEIVSRQEILERVWGKSIFIDTDSGINTAVRKVRRALQDDADTPRYLVAVPGRGYRFVGRIHEPEAQETRHGAEPLVGRVREVAALQASLAKAVAGHQGFVMISGEAGIGKSRLTEELIILAERDGMEVLIGHCVDPEESAPYLPFVEVLDVCVDRAETSADLRRLLGEEGPELAHLIPKISRTLPDLATKSLHLPAPEAQQLLFKSYRDFLTRLAEQKTILLVLEDLHWADDSTFALLRHLMQRMSGVAILVIGTYRDTELDVTPGLSRTLEESFRAGFNKLIRLEGLPSDEVGEMLGRLSGRVPSPQVVREVHEATAGNPFFVRELFRHLEAENRLYDAAGDFRPALKIAETEVPRSVKLLVRSRLDRINADTKHMLGIAALAGQSFTLEVLQAVIKSDRLVESIEQAERAGLVRSIPGSTAGRFVFSHELVRQAVIGGLAAVRRQRLHLELGASIELVYARTLDDHFADLAYHYRRGGNTRKAVEFLSRAAAQAIERAADAQALELATFAMDLLRRLPDDADRGRLELSIQLSYCNALRATEGLAAEALRQPLDRALKLSEQIGDQNSTILVLDSLRAFHQLKSELHRAQQIGERFVALAELSGDPVALARSSMSIGQTFLLQGRFGEARQRFELAVDSAVFDRIEGSQAAWWKTDALVGLALALWLLGFPQEAERRLVAILDAARPNPLAQAFALQYAGWLRLLFGQEKAALALARSAIAISTEYGFAFELSRSLIVYGNALILDGDPANGLSHVRQGISDLERTGGSASSLNLCSLVGGLLTVGEIKQGLEVVNSALAKSKVSNARLAEAELFRLKGELLLARGPSSAGQAEQAFRDAIEVAQGQGAKSWELRAVTSLTGLLTKTKRRKEARVILGEVCNWFTEGFESADFKNAIAQLHALSA